MAYILPINDNGALDPSVATAAPPGSLVQAAPTTVPPDVPSGPPPGAGATLQAAAPGAAPQINDPGGRMATANEAGLPYDALQSKDGSYVQMIKDMLARSRSSKSHAEALDKMIAEALQPHAIQNMLPKTTARQILSDFMYNAAALNNRNPYGGSEAGQPYVPIQQLRMDQALALHKARMSDMTSARDALKLEMAQQNSDWNQVRQIAAMDQQAKIAAAKDATAQRGQDLKLDIANIVNNWHTAHDESDLVKSQTMKNIMQTDQIDQAMRYGNGSEGQTADAIARIYGIPQGSTAWYQIRDAVARAAHPMAGAQTVSKTTQYVDQNGTQTERVTSRQPPPRQIFTGIPGVINGPAPVTTALPPALPSTTAPASVRPPGTFSRPAAPSAAPPTPYVQPLQPQSPEPRLIAKDIPGPEAVKKSRLQYNAAFQVTNRIQSLLPKLSEYDGPQGVLEGIRDYFATHTGDPIKGMANKAMGAIKGVPLTPKQYEAASAWAGLQEDAQIMRSIYGAGFRSDKAWDALQSLVGSPLSDRRQNEANLRVFMENTLGLLTPDAQEIAKGDLRQRYPKMTADMFHRYQMAVARDGMSQNEINRAANKMAADHGWR
jgi:hypothetical protein